ncbi:4-carboxymuconolactone decarboxylase [Streptomyces sp. SCL15-6]|uniref:bifunctional 3-oxoadipate enol-lactonase/4-carboxymuconolactone decarboxylase PcaDC n=1 Tax=Streptomyces sp. SCL15-6 TaxID=2967222 RepID=UPI002966C2CD|nr:4-carboxymuconolactone decarboxylase [Streptomyces sp. SCL15-6]
MSETPSNTLQYRFDGPEEAPVLILGPSLGTTWHMWDRQVPELAQQWRVFRFDLPGHGGAPAHAAGSVADLTARLLATLDGLGVQRFGYAGCAFGGAVGIELALRHPERLASLALIAASPRFGTADEFRQRGVIVRTNGLEPIARSAPERWFTGGFAAAQPAITEWAVQMVRTTDPGCYISACEALAAFDVRGELGHVGVPTLVLVGSDDQVTGPAEARTLVAGIPDARLAVVPGASHLVPVEQPAAVTDLLVRHFNTAWQTAHDASTGQIPVPPAAHPAVHAAAAGPAGSAAPVQPALAAPPVPAQASPVPAPAAPVPPQAVPAPPQAAPAPPRAVPVAEIAPAVVPPQAHAQGRPDPYDAGLKVRREVLGDAHVDRQLAQADEFSGDFQELLTRYAWGEIWDRPGLDRRTRSCVTLTALVAGGHLDEFAFHVRAALRNGLTPDEIKEVLLQAAVYCGVPAANSAFRVAQRVVREETTPPE